MKQFISQKDLPQIFTLIHQCNQAHLEGNFPQSDKLRTQLRERGVFVNYERMGEITFKYYVRAKLCNGVLSPSFCVGRLFNDESIEVWGEGGEYV